MCGVVGVAAQSNVNQTLYDSLMMLQHRGQDAAGMVTVKGSRLYLRKDTGMVRDVFLNEHMIRLVGNFGIGHVRYPTSGTQSSAEAQPFYVNSPYGITLAHNGNLTNADTIAAELFKTDMRHMNTDSDSEVLLNVFAHELQALAKHSPVPTDIFDALTNVYGRLEGAYAVVAMITGHGLLGFRDPFGIRPLVLGERRDENGRKEYMLASESVALTGCGFKITRDVLPGEAVLVDTEGKLHSRQCVPAQKYRPCIFEFVYFARPDSTIDGISVYQARGRMGVKLAERILDKWGDDHGIDVVIPIPETSRVSAQELAETLGISYREGFMKNRYIGRTFIMPGQELRKRSVRQKLSPLDVEFEGKHVLLVDDSIVRGTTCREIIQMAREAGAKSVSFASAAPPVKYPSVYGIDMPATSELIASGNTVEEMRDMIGADRLVFQNLDELCDAVLQGNPEIEGFDCAVFDGCYIAGDISEDYLALLAQNRGEDSNGGCGPKLEAAPSLDLTGITPATN